MHGAITPLNEFLIKPLSFTSLGFHMGFKSFDLSVAFCFLIPPSLQPVRLITQPLNPYSLPVLSQPFIFLDVLVHLIFLSKLSLHETSYILNETQRLRIISTYLKKSQYSIYLSFWYITMSNAIQIFPCSLFHVLLLSPCQDIIHHVEEQQKVLDIIEPLNQKLREKLSHGPSISRTLFTIV